MSFLLDLGVDDDRIESQDHSGNPSRFEVEETNPIGERKRPVSSIRHIHRSLVEHNGVCDHPKTPDARAGGSVSTMPLGMDTYS